MIKGESTNILQTQINITKCFLFILKMKIYICISKLALALLDWMQ